MAITTRDGIIAGLATKRTKFNFSKASIANQTAGAPCSLWRATGNPVQPGNPTAGRVLTHATAGAFSFPQRTSPETSYIAKGRVRGGNATQTVQVYDRISDCGGLSGTSVSSQTVGVTVAGTSNNEAERRGLSNCSELSWFLECYTDLGATPVSANCSCTFDDDTTGNIVSVAIPATWRAGRLLPIVSNVTGRYIKAVNTLALTATTGTAGNFGVTCGKLLAEMDYDVANRSVGYDWAGVGLPQCPNSAALWLVAIPSTTSSGTIDGHIDIIGG